MVEIWTDECRTTWKFGPSGDGKTIVELDPKTYLRYRCEHAQHDGYIYGYHKNQCVRRAIPTRDVFLEIWNANEYLYEHYFGSDNKSKAQEVLCKFIFDLRSTRSADIIRNNFSVLDESNLDKVMFAVNKLRNKETKKDIVEVLEKIKKLSKDLVYLEVRKS
jgi:hypothetical protein